MAEPLILEIKGNSLDDGPGIRTTVFFKGCPLDCSWCHNPESKRTAAEISFAAGECIACGACLEACPSGAVSSSEAARIDRSRCDVCGACARECPSGALRVVGRAMTVEEVVREVVKDKPFFDTSRGGATLSGGEPAMFMEYCSQLARALEHSGVRTIVETCGLFDASEFERRVLPHLEAVYFDLKVLDEAAHRAHCGASNRVILENFQSLMTACPRAGVELLARIPLVPGITATGSNLRKLAGFLSASGVKRVALLEYNPLWVEKEIKLGRAGSAGAGEEMRSWMDRAQVARCREIFSDFEICS